MQKYVFQKLFWKMNFMVEMSTLAVRGTLTRDEADDISYNCL